VLHSPAVLPIEPFRGAPEEIEVPELLRRLFGP